MVLTPATDFRYALKRGMSGTDVAALQINLSLKVDGEFGKETHKAVKTFQAAKALTVDGIAGQKTQQALCVELSAPATHNWNLPAGMLKSLMVNESGFYVAAVSRHPSDSGLDVGAYQRSTGTGLGSQTFYASAYNVKQSAETSAENLSGVMNGMPRPIDSSYLTDIGHEDRDRFTWQLAVLSHNWPYAAYNIPRRGHIFTDSARDDQPAAWIESASGGRLHTPREWVTSYIERCTVFVRW